MKKLKIKPREKTVKVLVVMPLDMKNGIKPALEHLRDRYPEAKWSQNTLIVESLRSMLLDIEKDK